MLHAACAALTPSTACCMLGAHPATFRARRVAASAGSDARPPPPPPPPPPPVRQPASATPQQQAALPWARQGGQQHPRQGGEQQPPPQRQGGQQPQRQPLPAQRPPGRQQGTSQRPQPGGQRQQGRQQPPVSPPPAATHRQQQPRRGQGARCLVVVEGLNDMRAVRRAAPSTDVYVLGSSTLVDSPRVARELEQAAARYPGGLLVLTDPDVAGRKARVALDARLPGRCRHAFLPARHAAARNATTYVGGLCDRAVAAWSACVSRQRRLAHWHLVRPHPALQVPRGWQCGRGARCTRGHPCSAGVRPQQRPSAPGV